MFQLKYIPLLLTNAPQELQQFLEHIRSLNYSDEPNYDFLQNCIHDACETRNFKHDDPLDWQSNGFYYQRYFKSMFEQ